MKKTLILLLLVLLLLLPSAAYAEEGVRIELMVADGVSYAVLTREPILGGTLKGGEEKNPGFRLPAFLTGIEASAFEGIDAACVEISENVESVGSRAFADCQNLREFHISESVKEIAEDALAGCENVTVYGTTEVAKAFADAAHFEYVDPSAEPAPSSAQEQQPVELPAIFR